MTTKPLLVVRHVPWEGPHTILDAFDGVPVRLIDSLDDGEPLPLPSVDEVRGAIFMGGPMSVNDTDRHPRLAEEVEWLRAAVAAELPLLGICLGSQLLARALGADRGSSVPGRTLRVGVAVPRRGRRRAGRALASRADDGRRGARDARPRLRGAAARRRGAHRPAAGARGVRGLCAAVSPLTSLPIDRICRSGGVLIPIRTMTAHDPSTFGAQLRARRRELGITQDDVADVIRVNRRVIGELERGKATVRLHIALDAARALGLDVRLDPRGR